MGPPASTFRAVDCRTPGGRNDSVRPGPRGGRPRRTPGLRRRADGEALPPCPAWPSIWPWAWMCCRRRRSPPCARRDPDGSPRRSGAPSSGPEPWCSPRRPRNRSRCSTPAGWICRQTCEPASAPSSTIDASPSWPSSTDRRASLSRAASHPTRARWRGSSTTRPRASHRCRQRPCRPRPGSASSTGIATARRADICSSRPPRHGSAPLSGNSRCMAGGTVDPGFSTRPRAC